ncbi:tetratricopeptide repeat protein [Verrucomicrobiota bacterium]
MEQHVQKCEIKKREAEVELRFLESVARRIPGDTEIMKALAELYTEAGRYAEGLELDQQLSRVCPADPLSWYNLGCSFALVGRKDESVEALSKAVEMGYDDYEWMKRDQDLAVLRDDPRFESLLSWIYGAGVEEDEFLL